jgi:hypothetical protein
VSPSAPPVRGPDDTTGEESSTTEDELTRGVAEPAALTEGFVNAFWAGAAIAFAGVLVSIFLVRGRDLRLPKPVISEPALEKAA